MRFSEISEDQVAVSLAADDLELFEMANLGQKYTGVQGIIYISTKQGSHGPRVKYYAGSAGSDQPNMSISVSDQPVIVASSLAKTIANKMFPVVKEWVQINHVGLVNFWNNGSSWEKDEVDAFVAGLTKVS